MEWENLEQRELLEQYLLGLTDRQQTARVEQMLREDPKLAEDLEELRTRMSDYIADQGLGHESPDRQRTSEDFHDLDHEMITAMTRRNHNLVIWRLALSAACLVLLFLAGYLFRENQNYRMAVDREKAIHAETVESARRNIELLQGVPLPIDSLHTETIDLPNGNILVHYVLNDQAAFLDLSHLNLPEPKAAFHLSLHAASDEQRIVLSDSLCKTLIPVTSLVERVRLWRQNPDNDTLKADERVNTLLADIPLVFRGSVETD